MVSLATGPVPDRVLRNGRIWTGRPEDDSAAHTAIALRDGRVLAVGGDAEVLDQVAADPEVIDLGGRRVIPGLIDSHLHAIRAGLTWQIERDWTRVYSLADALADIRAAAATRAAGEWIVALGGWQPRQFAEGRLPTRAELDEAAPRHPVFIHPLYGLHDVAVVNTAAVAAMGWTDGMADPAGGELLRAADGASLTGELRGLGLYAQINAVALTPSPREEEASTRAFFEHLAALGLTGVVDAGGMGMSPDRYRAVYDVWRRGELAVRIRTLHCAVTAGHEVEEVAAWQRFLHPGAGDGMLAVLGMGEAVHYGCHDWEAMAPFTIDDPSWQELLGIATRCAEAGWPLTVHAIFDESVGRILDAFEVVAKEHDLGQLRFSLCHVECISVENLERARQLGIGLALQGRMVGKAAAAAEAWGAETLEHAPPFGDLQRLGMPFGAGTDGTRSGSYDPWRTIWWMVTGEVLDGGPRRAEAHRLSRADALRAYTSGSAWFSFEESQRGQLVAGRLADLAVLSEDVFAVDDDAIPDITAVLTVVDGRVAHAAGPFADLPVERHPPAAAPTRW